MLMAECIVGPCWAVFCVHHSRLRLATDFRKQPSLANGFGFCSGGQRLENLNQSFHGWPFPTRKHGTPKVPDKETNGLPCLFEGG